MKKILLILMVMMLSLGLFAACADKKTGEVDQNGAKTTIKIASLKGPTSMGLAKLMADNEEGTTANDYDFQIKGTADEIVTQIVSGEIDAAAVPCNLSSVLYNKTEGNIKVAAINTLGVLYILENGQNISALTDLKDKTVYSTGKGTTPEYVLNYLLEANDLDPQKDVKIEFKSESTELAALLNEDKEIIAVLPEPYVTTVTTKNPDVRIALSFTEEWDKVAQDDSSLVTGVLIVRNDFLENNPEAFEAFLKEYQASTEFVNANPAESAVWIDQYGIVAKDIAEKAIPNSNITFLTGQEMADKVGGYLKALHGQDPQAVGGTLPDDNFFYIK